jgi:flagellar assembly protein FliH
MQSSRRKVIKAEEVRVVSAPEKSASESPGTDPVLSVVERTALEAEMAALYAQKIQAAEQESYARGVSEGIQKGIEIQKNENLKPLKSLVQLIVELSEAKKKTIESAEEQIIQLSLAVAEKVIHLEVTTNREVILGVLKEAIRNIVDRENMKIHIHPDDLRYIMEIKPDFIKSFDGMRNVVFEEDRSVGQGGALIETLCGEVDARLEQQYHEIETTMRAHVHQG